VAAGPGGGTVYVTGTGNDSRYATLAYRARTGSRKWINLTGANADAFAMALSKDGSKVFVTGTNHGYWTIAIQT
jgi:site-specific recombinase XerC